ncbi:MAG: hypothetical protein Sylvanvirus23_10, partial [Sylvanvirus sp.]
MLENYISGRVDFEYDESAIEEIPPISSVSPQTLQWFIDKSITHNLKLKLSALTFHRILYHGRLDLAQVLYQSKCSVPFDLKTVDFLRYCRDFTTFTWVYDHFKFFEKNIAYFMTYKESEESSFLSRKVTY